MRRLFALSFVWIFLLISCSTSPEGPEVGTIVVDPNPDSIDPTWHLVGPEFDYWGSGDETLEDVSPGAYTITWGDFAGWHKPENSPSSQILYDGGTITFTAQYQQFILYSRDIMLIFESGDCGICHANPFGLDLNPEYAYGSLVGVPSREEPPLLLVEPLDPENSVFYRRVSSTDPDYRMPMGSALSIVDIENIRLWIVEGALDN